MKRKNCLILVATLLHLRFPNVAAAPRQADELYGQHANYAPVYRQEAPQSISLTQTAVYSPRYSQGNTIVASSEEYDCIDEENPAISECNGCQHPTQRTAPQCPETGPECPETGPFCPETGHHSQPKLYPHACPGTCDRSQPEQTSQSEACSQPKPEKGHCRQPEKQLEKSYRCSSCDEEELVRAANVERIEELVASYIADYLINQLLEDNNGGCSKSDGVVRILDPAACGKRDEQRCERSTELCCEVRDRDSAGHEESGRHQKARGKREETETYSNYSASCPASELDILAGVEGRRSLYGCSLTEI